MRTHAERAYVKIMDLKVKGFYQEFIERSWYKKDMSKLIIEADLIVNLMIDLDVVFPSQSSNMVKAHLINLLKDMRTYEDNKSEE